MRVAALSKRASVGASPFPRSQAAVVEGSNSETRTSSPATRQFQGFVAETCKEGPRFATRMAASEALQGRQSSPPERCRGDSIKGNYIAHDRREHDPVAPRLTRSPSRMVSSRLTCTMRCGVNVG